MLATAPPLIKISGNLALKIQSTRSFPATGSLGPAAAGSSLLCSSMDGHNPEQELPLQIIAISSVTIDG